MSLYTRQLEARQPLRSGGMVVPLVEGGFMVGAVLRTGKGIDVVETTTNLFGDSDNGIVCIDMREHTFDMGTGYEPLRLHKRLRRIRTVVGCSNISNN